MAGLLKWPLRACGLTAAGVIPAINRPGAGAAGRWGVPVALHATGNPDPL